MRGTDLIPAHSYPCSGSLAGLGGAPQGEAPGYRQAVASWPGSLGAGQFLSEVSLTRVWSHPWAPQVESYCLLNSHFAVRTEPSLACVGQGKNPWLLKFSFHRTIHCPEGKSECTSPL